MATDDGSEEIRTEALAYPGRPHVHLASFRLVVIEGPDLGQSVPVDARNPHRVLVGHSKSCQLALSDRSVSRRHVAFDVTPKGVTLTDLGSTNGTLVGDLSVASATLRGGEHIRLGNTVLRLEEAESGARTDLSPSAGFGRLVGASIAMRRLYPLLERLASSDLPVLLEGETGTGKELAGECLHEQSPRRGRPFVVFDCGAVPESSIGALLFGDGQPQGASAFEQAADGTLLVDEVIDLPTEAQVRLGRILDRKELRRADGSVVPMTARLLATTKADLDAEVEAGRFREELLLALAVGRIELPPLRHREGDVQLLAQTFWQRMAGAARPFPQELLMRYERHNWPGNVRELENILARRMMLGAFDVAATPEANSAGGFDPFEPVLALDLPLSQARARVVQDFEARYLERILAQHKGNVTRAAAASGVARRYFQILKAKLGK